EYGWRLNIATLANGTNSRKSRNSAYGPVRTAQIGRARTSFITMRSAAQQPQVRGLDDDVDMLCRRPSPRCVGVLHRGTQPVSARDIEIEVNVLTEIGDFCDTGGNTVLSGRRDTARRLDVNALGPEQDRDIAVTWLFGVRLCETT